MSGQFGLYDVLNSFKDVINATDVTDALDMQNTGDDYIKVPQGNFLEDEMPELDYWMRIVVMPRIRSGAVRDFPDGVVAYWVQTRVDIMPPNDSDFDIELKTEYVHKMVYKHAQYATPSVDEAQVIAPFWRVARPNTLYKTQNEYLSNRAVYKTILGEQ